MSAPPAISRARTLALGLVALLFAAAPVQAQLGRGSRPEFTFERPPVNGQGTSSLADLQGKLVWVEFWGTY